MVVVVKATAWSLYPKKETRYYLYGKLGGAESRSGQVQKISPPRRFEPKTVQTVASSCSDSAVPAH